MSYLTLKQPKPSGQYSGYAGLGEAKNQSPFTRSLVQQSPGYMYSGSPGSMATRAPYYQGAVGPGTSPTGFGGQSPDVRGGSTETFPNQGGTTTTTGGTNGGGGAGGSSSSRLFDPTTDPILQRIKALGTRNVADAVAGGDALRKQLLTQFGDPALARSQMFGDLNSGTIGDENTALAAAGNPFSTVAGLQHQHELAGQGIDNTDNQANLYYSSTHANHLGDENTNYLHGISDAQGALQSQLGGINGQLLSAHQAADMANIDALGTSTQNLINAAIQSGYSFGGYDAAGNPILTKAGDSGGAATAPPGGTAAPGGDGTAVPPPNAPGGATFTGGGALPSIINSVIGTANAAPNPLLLALSQQNQKRLQRVPLG